MPTFLIRAAAVLAVALPLAGCLSYTTTPAPAPVVVTTPDSGPTIIKPAY